MASDAAMDQDLLTMALVGYEAEIGKIKATIADIRARLGEQVARGDGQPASKRTMSVAGRRRIAAAQRKRWAEFKKDKAAKAAPKKRKLSAAGRKAIIEATRKRWAAYRKAGGKKGKAAAKKAATATAS